MRYKNLTKGVEEIGRELRVGTVLEGSIRKAGNKLRVTAQLIDVESLGHLWAQSYDRELDDIFKIQEDIAGKIAEALKVRLAPGQGPAGKHTESIEAYTLYLRGRTLWNRWDKEGILESLKLFQEAIRIDPTYARAYSGLADAYAVAAESDFMNLADGYAKSKEAATRALELDDTLAEAHASLGVNLWHDLRFEEVHRELRRAIELNPSDALAHRWYSEFLLDLGRMKEATDEIMKACELDPFSPGFTARVAVTYIQGGRLDEAIAICDKLIESEPTNAGPYYLRSSCFMRKYMKERAYADLEACHRLQRDEDAYKCSLAEIDLWFGEREKASSMMEELISKVGRPHILEMDIAWCYAVLGNKDECFKWIDKAISAKRIYPALLRYSPAYDKVRDDPRFPEIFRKLGLPD
jgi:tetratricopeptide (TPR) repeat protein